MANVLIVDDDETVRMYLARALDGWGHQIAGVARNLAEALAEAEVAKKKGIQIAIVDGNLGSGPGTEDGKATAAALRKCAPGVRIIAHTGQANGEYGDIFLQKPSSMAEMKSAIEKALAMGPTL